jgi:hypothetical protein
MERNIEERYREAVMAKILKIASDDHFLWDSEARGLTEENFEERVSCSFWNLASVIYQEAAREE